MNSRGINIIKFQFFSCHCMTLYTNQIWNTFSTNWKRYYRRRRNGKLNEWNHLVPSWVRTRRWRLTSPWDRFLRNNTIPAFSRGAPRRRDTTRSCSEGRYYYLDKHSGVTTGAPCISIHFTKRFNVGEFPTEIYTN